MPLNRRWTGLWKIWILIGIFMELYALARGRKPLTGVARKYWLHHPVGSAVIGSFFGWMIWHWLFDIAGLDHMDVIGLLVGALVGLSGFLFRNR
jgi:hypothetical protein